MILEKFHHLESPFFVHIIGEILARWQLGARGLYSTQALLAPAPAAAARLPPGAIAATMSQFVNERAASGRGDDAEAMGDDAKRRIVSTDTKT